LLLQHLRLVSLVLSQESRKPAYSLELEPVRGSVTRDRLPEILFAVYSPFSILLLLGIHIITCF
jgi:hypothetical protein